MKTATTDEPYPGYIYMDTMGFGMGCSCLQVTYEAASINHARYLYDALLPFTPIMACLSASAPIYKGKLSDIDFRWKVISESVDDRTSDELDPSSPHYVPKSRYDTVNHYISNHEYVKPSYFDTIQYNVNPSHLEQLMKQGGEEEGGETIDQRLAFHIASIFIRDPIPAYTSELEFAKIDDNTSSGHFENIQSTNWNSLRFKPPPSQKSEIGWRVEFRTMDI